MRPDILPCRTNSKGYQFSRYLITGRRRRTKYSGTTINTQPTATPLLALRSKKFQHLSGFCNSGYQVAPFPFPYLPPIISTLSRINPSSGLFLRSPLPPQSGFPHCAGTVPYGVCPPVCTFSLYTPGARLCPTLPMRALSLRS